MYRSRRKGWPVNLNSLTPDIIQKLHEEGATQLVLLFKEPLSANLVGFIEVREKKDFSVRRKDGTVWTLWVLSL
jgi:hypothetical protein